MSIRPVDYQILMPKVNEMAKIQSSEMQKQISHLQQQAENTVEQAERDTRTVHSRREAEKIAITEKQQERRNDSRPKQKNRQMKQAYGKENGKAQQTVGTGSIIDIRL